jgi:hypothetical protein
MYGVTVTAYSGDGWSGSSGTVTLTNPSGVAVNNPGSPKVSVQLAFVLDGSGSIGQSNFNIALQGLAAAIRDPATVPQDGSVELTIIEFGDSILAKVEVMPVVITSQTVANTVADLLCQGTNCGTHALEYLGGYTPTASAIYLATDTLKASPNYADWKRQAINLVTDGGPNACPVSDTDRYHATQCDSESNGGPNGRAAAQAALTYARTTLAMTADKDEFDSEFIGTDATCSSCSPASTNSEWLRASIVWPTQTTGGGYFAPPFDKGPGWVRKITDWTQFANTVQQKFKMVLKFGLTVVKQVNGGSKAPGDFTLYVKDSSGNNVAGSPFYGSLGGTTFSDLPAGTYTVTEDQISGYSLVISGDCDSSGQVTLGSTGEKKQCAFTNNYGGPWLKIVKNSGDNDGTFGFTVTGPSPSTPSIDTHFGTGDTGFFPIDPSSPGNLYTVAEASMPSGWVLVSSSCTKATGSPFSPQGFTASIGDSITCTFTDTGQGQLKIVKNTIGGDATFGFTVSGPTPSSPSLTTVTGKADTGFVTVTAGTYSVSESPIPANWVLTTASCNDGSSSFSNPTVSGIAVGVGAQVTCTFTDTSTKASPTISTSVSPASITIGGSATDTATLTGGNNPTGTVDFTVYSDSSCTTSVFTSINRPVSSGSATSEPFLPGAVGTYYWKAVYSGDSNNNGVSGACGVGVSGETLTVNKAATSIATAVHDVGHNVVTSVPLNSMVHDSASVGTQVGSLVIGGQVTYNFYTGSACSGTPTWTDAVSVGSESKATDVLAAGEYRFQAVYLGDNNYSGSTSSCETLTVGKAAPTLSTTVVPSTVNLGDTVHDTASFTGLVSGFDVTGTVTYSFWKNGACSLAADSTEDVTITAGSVVPPSPDKTGLVAGSYSYKAHHGGDGNYGVADSECEPFTVGKAAPTLSTLLSADKVPVLTSVTDTATLSGGVNPTGKITFYVYPAGDATCSTSPIETFTADVNGNSGYTSPTFTPSSVGVYQWLASYGGDDNNKAVSSRCGDEPLEVQSGLGMIQTSLSASEVEVGIAVTDSATLSAVTSTAGGNIVFKVFSGSDTTCALTPVFTSNQISVAGPDTYGSSTPDFVPSSAGTYRWQAFYSGDSNNNAAMSSCSAEILTVNPVAPTISTKLSTSQIVIGDSVTDSATLSGATNDAGGTVVFKVFTTSDCSGSAVFTSNAISVDGNGNYGPSQPNFTPSNAGLYYWQAFYGGDGNNEAVKSECSAEVLEVGASLGTISTSLSATSISIGDKVHDSATLSGATSDAGGDVTYAVYDGGSCSGAALDTSKVTVTAGVVLDSKDFDVFDSAGTYSFQAIYSGDANNKGATSVCGTELLKVNQNEPSISTLLSASQVMMGMPVSDTATLSSGVTPTGTITFNVYPAGDTTCHLNPIKTYTVNVNGNSKYTSDPFTPSGVGVYQWVAAYSGDDNNKPASSNCGDEPLEVGASTTTSTTTTSETTSSTTSSTSTTTTTTTDTTESTFSLSTTSTSQTTPDAPVGGHVYSVSKADLLEPYFALAALLVVLAVVLGKKRRS